MLVVFKNLSLELRTGDFKQVLEFFLGQIAVGLVELKTVSFE